MIQEEDRDYNEEEVAEDFAQSPDKQIEYSYTSKSEGFVGISAAAENSYNFTVRIRSQVNE